MEDARIEAVNAARVYRLQTMSHPVLGEYLSWRSVPPESGVAAHTTGRTRLVCLRWVVVSGRNGGNVANLVRSDGREETSRFRGRSWPGGLHSVLVASSGRSPSSGGPRVAGLGGRTDARKRAQMAS
jgi:hypothetical protein